MSSYDEYRHWIEIPACAVQFLGRNETLARHLANSGAIFTRRPFRIGIEIIEMVERRGTALRIIRFVTPLQCHFLESDFQSCNQIMWSAERHLHSDRRSACQEKLSSFALLSDDRAYLSVCCALYSVGNIGTGILVSAGFIHSIKRLTLRQRGHRPHTTHILS